MLIRKMCVTLWENVSHGGLGLKLMTDLVCWEESGDKRLEQDKSVDSWLYSTVNKQKPLWLGSFLFLQKEEAVGFQFSLEHIWQEKKKFKHANFWSVELYLKRLYLDESVTFILKCTCDTGLLTTVNLFS